MLDGMTQVVMAQDGADCLKLYQEHKPDMAFLDIHLPILTGFELVDQLLKIDPSAYLVVMSSDSTAENVQAALKAGARGFLAKPLQRPKLMQYMNTCPTIRWMDQRFG
jgi:two-component system chemotaxis response regulator CheY